MPALRPEKGEKGGGAPLWCDRGVTSKYLIRNYKRTLVGMVLPRRLASQRDLKKAPEAYRVASLVLTPPPLWTVGWPDL